MRARRTARTARTLLYQMSAFEGLIVISSPSPKRLPIYIYPRSSPPPRNDHEIMSLEQLPLPSSVYTSSPTLEGCAKDFLAELLQSCQDVTLKVERDLQDVKSLVHKSRQQLRAATRKTRSSDVPPPSGLSWLSTSPRSSPTEEYRGVLSSRSAPSRTDAPSSFSPPAPASEASSLRDRSGTPRDADSPYPPPSSSLPSSSSPSSSSSSSSSCAHLKLIPQSSVPIQHAGRPSSVPCVLSVCGTGRERDEEREMGSRRRRTTTYWSPTIAHLAKTKVM